jgi:hypothetical protein
MGRYVSQPLTVNCTTVREVRAFLATCRGVSDKDQFGKNDYWQPPDQFEQTRKGDCDDFALWTWRQFLNMGYNARFVLGRHGRYGMGHAWVTFESSGRCFLVEPQFRNVGYTFPRLSTLFYHPMFSVAWDGEKIAFFSHQDLANQVRVWRIPSLLTEWIVGWGFFWFVSLPRLPRILWQRLILR